SRRATRHRRDAIHTTAVERPAWRLSSPRDGRVGPGRVDAARVRRAHLDGCRRAGRVDIARGGCGRRRAGGVLARACVPGAAGTHRLRAGGAPGGAAPVTRGTVAAEYDT